MVDSNITAFGGGPRVIRTKGFHLIWRYNIAFGLIIITCIFIVAFGTNYLTQVPGRLHEVTDVRMPASQAILHIEKGMADVIIAEQELIISSRRSNSLQQFDEIERANNRVKAAWNRYDSLPRSAPEQTLWEEFFPVFTRWESVHSEILLLVQEMDSLVASGETFHSEELVLIYEDLADRSSEVKQIYIGAGLLLESLLEANNESAKNQVVQVDRALVRTIDYSVIVSSFGAIFVTLLAIYISRMIRQFIKQSQSTNESKTQFLANMSHEIRTPLNLIIGMTEVLEDTQLTPDQAKYVRILHNSGEALYTLINDILDLSKIEAGSIVLEEQDFNLVTLVEETVDLMNILAREKGLDLNCRIDSTVPVWVRGDAGRLRQILVNLIANGIKFTDAGGISVVVEVRRPKRQALGQQLLVSIQDTGIGIPADKLELIFDNFAQADVSSTRNYEGSGLGLAISRNLVELMGGKLWVKSTVGFGSTFYFTVNLNPAESSGEVAVTIDGDSAEGGSPLKILLAEDNEDNQLLVRQFLKYTPHQLDFALNGEEAVEKVIAGDYDLVLMDIQMPVLDGYQATRSIRQWEKDNDRQSVAIIALTAYSLKTEIEKMIRAGCNGHVPKPIKKKTLLNVISRYSAGELPG